MKGRPVLTSVPPVATMGPLARVVNVKRPLASVTANASPASSRPLPLASANTVAPVTIPSRTRP